MKSNKVRTNTTTFSAKIPENEVTAVLCELLAKEHGLDLDPSTTRFRGYHSSEDTSTGFKHSWNVEVTVDHSREPSVKEQP
jgi:hypothetical protein